MFAAVLSAGCITSLQDLRTQPPGRTGIATGDYRVLANCTAAGLQEGPRNEFRPNVGNYIYQVIDRAEQKRATVTGILGFDGTPVIDLNFRAAEPGQVLVESRWTGPLLRASNGRRVDEYAWPIIETCAGAPVILSPPLTR